MKRRTILPNLVSLAATLGIMCSPLRAAALEGPPAVPVPPPVLITEVQTGSATSASEEFIELYNASASPIDFAAYAWRIEVASATATSWDTPLRTIPLTGSIGAGEYYSIASQYTAGGQSVRYLASSARAWFSAGLSATAGHIRVTYTANGTLPDGICGPTQTAVDAVEWSAPAAAGAATPSIDGRPALISAKSGGIPGGSSIQRLLASGMAQYQDSGSDAADFLIAAIPTPGLVTAAHAASVPAQVSAEPGLPADTCSVMPPIGGEGGDDSGVPAGDPPPAGDGQAGDTGSAGNDTSTSQPPDAASDTDAGDNLLPPVLTELLPNPAPPYTDAADEFIELYNPNTTAIAIGGYIAETGLTTTHRYTLPQGTMLPAGAYMALYASQTGLSLSNSGGQVRLLAPDGSLITASDPYGAAKDGQSWMLQNGVWGWTATPTPGAQNVLTVPLAAKAPIVTASVAKKASKPKATPEVKAARVKAAKLPKAKKAKSAKKNSSSAANTAVLATDPVKAKRPLHPSILAVIGVIAILYGAYEYRQDMANYFRRRRGHRAAGTEDRPRAARG